VTKFTFGIRSTETSCCPLSHGAEAWPCRVSPGGWRQSAAMTASVCQDQQTLHEAAASHALSSLSASQPPCNNNQHHLFDANLLHQLVRWVNKGKHYRINKQHKPNLSRSSVLLIPLSNSLACSPSKDRWSNRAAFISASLCSFSFLVTFICSNFQHTSVLLSLANRKPFGLTITGSNC